MNFPVLYKRASTGRLLFWAISVERNAIVITFGQMGGKNQKTTDTILSGKNVLRSNATTPEQQAGLEAQSQWEKKVKKGYVQDPDAAMAGEVDTAVITGGIDVMLAHRYDEQGHKIVYPAYAQPKLDGHRCVAIVKNGKCTLWSRTRKPITGVPHVIRDIEEALRFMFGPAASDADLIFDGELYTHDYRDKFEELTSFIRQVTPKPGHEVVQFHIYDTPSCETDYTGRLDWLYQFFAVNPQNSLVMVETREVADEDELMLAFDRFLELGYEGAMARNAGGRYVGKRSYDLLKLKEFLDGEYPCIAVEEGRGKFVGHAIFVCTVDPNNPTDSNTEFRAKMKGDTVELKKYWDDPTLAVGKMVTVKYQGLTKNGIPRFPVALRIREDV